MSDVQWVEVGAQHQRIGGTGLGTLMSAGWDTGKVLDLYNWIVHGVVAFTGNAYTERGNKYESVVRAEFVRQTGVELLPHDQILYMEDCFAATLDDLCRRMQTVFPVDYKTASNSASNLKKWGPSGSTRFPKHYQIQLRLYMAVLNYLGIKVDHSELFAAFGEDVKDAEGNFTGEFKITEHRHYHLPRDVSLEEQALEVGRKFWKLHIVPKIPPSTEVTLSVKLSAEDMALFDSFMSTADVTPAAPAAPAPTPIPPPIANAPVVQPPLKPLPNSEDVRAGDCIVGTFYKLPGGTIGEFTGTSRDNAFFQVGEDPDATGSSVRLPVAALVQKTTRTETPALVAASETEPAAILPPDAPKSQPELAADCPHCPLSKSGKPTQHALADCPTLNKPPAPAAEDKPKRGRPRTKIQDNAPGEVAPASVVVVAVPTATPAETLAEQTAKVEAARASGAVLTTTEKIAALDAGVPGAKVIPPTAADVAAFATAKPTAGTLMLFVNSEPRSGPRPERLEPYVALLAAGLAKTCGAGDIRASDDKRLGFGKWKGALAAAAQANPPKGVFQISTADSDFASVVVEALTPLCAPGWPVFGTR